MAIDDPLEAIRQQISATDREHNPISEAIARIIGELVPGGFVIRDFMERHREENRELLLNVVISEIRSLQLAVTDLTEKHQAFLRDEYPGLLMDGFKKAETVRARERVARMGRILATSAQEGPNITTDETEEMMRIALELGDADVAFLKVLARASLNATKLPTSPPPPGTIEYAVAETRAVNVGSDEQTGICLKLQSLGLVIAMRGLDRTSRTFGILPKTYRFIKFIRESN